MIRLMLVDDHGIVRAGIRSLVDSLPDIEVAGEADSGPLAMVKLDVVKPDVVLLDIALPGMNGFDVAMRIHRRFPQAGIVMLSMYTHEEYVMHALSVGALGYIGKDFEAEELELAIRQVSRGKRFLASDIDQGLLDRFDTQQSQQADRIGGLTQRQREILCEMGKGRSTKEIAYQRGLSRKTVDAHRAQIMQRLDIFDMHALMHFAVRNLHALETRDVGDDTR